MSLIKAAVAAAIGIVALTSAQASTISFDNVGDDYGLSTYSEAGYTLSLSHGMALATPQTYLVLNPPISSGTLISSVNLGDVSGFTLTRQDQQPFVLFSFGFGGVGSTAIDKLVITGLDVSGASLEWTLNQPSSTSQIYLLDPADTRWKSLVSVDFAAYGAHNRAVFDNIVVFSSAVPEPSPTASMLLGLLGIGLALKRRSTPSPSRSVR